MIELSEDIYTLIQENKNCDVRKLALRMSKRNIKNASFILDQITGWQIAVIKIPSWASCSKIIYPAHLSMEQCSSESTATYKAKLISHLGNVGSFVDLTTGFGVDFSIIARQFKYSICIEKQKELCEIVSHNLSIFNIKNVTAINGDGLIYLQKMKPVDWIFIDPARRDEHGGKLVAINDCEPDITQWINLFKEKSKHTLIKLSPMLDISIAIKELKDISHIHIVSVNNECKELLLVLDKEEDNPIIHTANITDKGIQYFEFTQNSEIESPCNFCDTLGKYLYEPNASLLKAGAFRSLSFRFHMEKLHPNSHLYTSSFLNKDFPGRVFHIEDICHFNKKNIRTTLHGIDKANITIRNFPLSVHEIRKITKISEGGEWFLFATTLKQEEKVLIKCKKA